MSPGLYYLGAIVDDLDRVARTSETNNARVAASRPHRSPWPRAELPLVRPGHPERRGPPGSFFTSELILTNRGNREAGSTSPTGPCRRGKRESLRHPRPGPAEDQARRPQLSEAAGHPIPGSGNRIGTLAVEAVSTDRVGVLVRTTTAVPEGRAGLAYPGIAAQAGFHETVYLCGCARTRRPLERRSPAHGNRQRRAHHPEDRGLLRRPARYGWTGPGGGDARAGRVPSVYRGARQSLQRLCRRIQVRWRRPFYAYGVINDQANSDGSFVFPVTSNSLSGTCATPCR